MTFGEKLSSLLRARFQEPENEREIDREIWQTYGREAAVIITDLTRYTVITKERGILHFLAIIQQYRDLIEPLIDQYDGEIIKVEGDSLYLVFNSSVNAVKFAIDSRSACDDYNKNTPEDRQVNLCQGIAVGEVLVVPGDLFGDAVNTASKLGEDTAGARDILISEEVFLQVENELLGEVFQRQEVQITGMKLGYYAVK